MEWTPELRNRSNPFLPGTAINVMMKIQCNNTIIHCNQHNCWWVTKIKATILKTPFYLIKGASGLKSITNTKYCSLQIQNIVLKLHINYTKKGKKAK
jgi:hypothetical protein